jgi:hypothetical protein
MSPKWIIGILMAMIVMQLICGVCEMSYGFGDTPSRIQTFLSPPVPSYSNPAQAVFAYITVGWEWLSNLFWMFWWDYSFFSGSWQMVRYIFFLPISVGVVVMIVLVAMRGVTPSG